MTAMDIVAIGGFGFIVVILTLFLLGIWRNK